MTDHQIQLAGLAVAFLAIVGSLAVANRAAKAALLAIGVLGFLGSSALLARSLFFPDRPPLGLTGQCKIAGFPFRVPAHGAINLVMASPKLLKPKTWGFVTMNNDGDQDEFWPPKRVLESLNDMQRLQIWGAKCNVSNHGTANIYAVAWPLTFNFGLSNKHMGSVQYPVVVGPLDVGQSETFYISGLCSPPIFVMTPDTGSAKRTPTDNWEIAPIGLDLSNPVTRLGTGIPPSDVNWNTGRPCSAS